MKSKQGGKREGAGRKPAEDPKVCVQIYVRQSIIDNLGGMKYAKEKALAALNNKQS